MKKIAAAPMLTIVLITAALLICAPNKAANQTIVDENVINKTALSGSTSSPSDNPTENSSQTQQPTSMQGTHQPQLTHYEDVLPLPSPFIVALFIIGSVSVCGLILSLCLRKRGRKQASASSDPTQDNCY